MTDRYEKIRELIAERDQLAAEVEALRAELDESCAVGDKLARLLEETAIVIKGPEPDMTKWSYHDIPDGVRAIQARAERLAEALADILSRSAMNLAMNPNPFELTAMLGDIHQIAGAALAQEEEE